METWQIYYHLIVFLIAVTVHGIIRFLRPNANAGMTEVIPFVLATLAEWYTHTFLWPNMLASDAQAGVGLIFSWIINVVLGIIAGALVLGKPRWLD